MRNYAFLNKYQNYFVIRKIGHLGDDLKKGGR